MPITEYLSVLRTHVGHSLLLVPAAAALIFNEKNEVLLCRRSDNGKWAEIGGMIEPGGESPADAAVREALEEAGVSVVIERVTGVYTSPAVTYPNGDQAQYVNIAFRCRIVSGVPHAADDESTDGRFFPLDGLPPDLSPTHRNRIMDAAEPGAGLPAVFL